MWKGEGIISQSTKEETNMNLKIRGITLMDMAYKIYMNILNEKLVKEAEKKLKEMQEINNK